MGWPPHTFSQLLTNEGVFSLQCQPKVLLIVETVGFLYKLKLLTLLCYDLSLKLDRTEYLLLQSNLNFAMNFCVKHFVTLFRYVLFKYKQVIIIIIII